MSEFNTQKWSENRNKFTLLQNLSKSATFFFQYECLLCIKIFNKTIKFKTTFCQSLALPPLLFSFNQGLFEIKIFRGMKRLSKILPAPIEIHIMVKNIIRHWRSLRAYKIPICLEEFRQVYLEENSRCATCIAYCKKRCQAKMWLASKTATVSTD